MPHWRQAHSTLVPHGLVPRHWVPERAPALATRAARRRPPPPPQSNEGGGEWRISIPRGRSPEAANKRFLDDWFLHTVTCSPSGRPCPPPPPL